MWASQGSEGDPAPHGNSSAQWGSVQVKNKPMKVIVLD
nr:MAG TPA_asm: hypothetical protein [Caudoviricetes sp.]